MMRCISCCHDSFSFISYFSDKTFPRALLSPDNGMSGQLYVPSLILLLQTHKEAYHGISRKSINKRVVLFISKQFFIVLKKAEDEIITVVFALPLYGFPRW